MLWEGRRACRYHRGWLQIGPELAIGSGKGNLYIYNRQSQTMVPVSTADPTTPPTHCA